MKSFISLVILIILLSCKENNVAKVFPQNKRNAIFIKEISNKNYRFEMSYSKDSINKGIIRCDKIVIFDRDKKSNVQEIKIDTIEMNENNIYFSIDEDVNFDGNNDLCILNYEGSYTVTYTFWLFDKTNHLFNHYEGLDEIQNPVIIKKRKEICSSWHSGLTSFNQEKYFWKNNLLTLKEKIEENWYDKGYLKTTKLINDKYVVKDSVIQKNVVMFMKCD